MNTDNILYVNKLLKDTEHLSTNSDLYKLDPPEQNLRDMMIEALCELHVLDPKKHPLPDEILAEQEWDQLGEDDDYEWQGNGWHLCGCVNEIDETVFEFVETTAQDKHYNPLQARFRKIQHEVKGTEQ